MPNERERWKISTRRRVDKLHFSPDGRLLFGMVEPATEGGMMWVWDVEKGLEISSTSNCWASTLVYTLPQFTADQRRLAIPYGNEGQVCLWDFAGSGKPLVLEGRHQDCSNLALSPNGETLATVGAGMVKLWDVQSGRVIGVLEGRGCALAAVTFSPDGERVIAGGEDEVKVWDLRTHREVANLCGATVDGWVLRFQDRDTLVVLTGEDVLRLHAPSFAEIEAAEGR